MPGKQDPQRQGSQRDQDINKDRSSNLGEQDQSRRGQGTGTGSGTGTGTGTSSPRQGSQQGSPDRFESDRSTSNPQKSNNPERGSDR